MCPCHATNITVMCIHSFVLLGSELPIYFIHLLVFCIVSTAVLFVCWVCEPTNQIGHCAKAVGGFFKGLSLCCLHLVSLHLV